MPTYEYECPSCGHRFEKFQGMSDAPVKACPKCGQNIKRLIGAGAGIISKENGPAATNRGCSDGSSCSFDTTGTTCCGRSSRCDSASCET